MSITTRQDRGPDQDVEVFEGSGLTRSRFLKAGGALVIGLVFPAVAETATAQADRAPVEQVPTLYPVPAAGIDPAVLSSYLAINADGTVAAYTGKLEIGNGNQTSISQIIAEELYLTIDKINLTMGSTDTTIDQGPTVGSGTTKAMWGSLRPAAAFGYQTLLQMASSRLGVPATQLRASGGVFTDVNNASNTVSYGALVNGQVLTQTLNTAKVTAMKPIGEYTVVGTSPDRVDIPAKVLGTYEYIQDVRVPGMLHGRVIRPPAIGAKLLTVGPAPSGVKIVRIENFLAVAAEDEWTAIQAAENLKTTWTEWKGLPKQSDLRNYILSSPETPGSPALMTASADASSPTGTINPIPAPPDLTMAQAQANVNTALAGAAKSIFAEYDTPMETHGSLGPSCAVASVQPDQVVVWSGTVGPSGIRGTIAGVLGVDKSIVHVHPFPPSGSYGRSGADAVTVDAALMAQALGVPVRVQWTRADEHQWDPKGPATIHQMKGGIDAAGNVVAYYHEGWLAGAELGTTLISAALAGKTALMASAGGWSSAYQVYTFPPASTAVVVHSQPDLATQQNDGWGVFSAPLRSPGQFQVTFAHESFVDELAALAGVDPVAFRLKYLTDERYISVLNHIAGMAGWQKRPSPSGDASSSKRVVTGRGVAMALRGGTYAGNVAEVSVDRHTGKITVNKIWGAQDCGLAVNPRAIQLGAVSGIMQGVSRTLMEEITFDQSIVTSNDWSSYPVIRFEEAPEVAFDVIDNPAFTMNGSGEPPMTPTAAAINNAVFDATGVRLRSMPLKPAKVQAALKAAGKYVEVEPTDKPTTKKK
jgi:nicotinate dehydrogenase subunit B